MVKWLVTTLTMRPQPCATSAGAICFGHHEGAIDVGIDGSAPCLGVVLVEPFARADLHVAEPLHPDAGVIDETVD
jgi:hypothetical protein